MRTRIVSSFAFLLLIICPSFLVFGASIDRRLAEQVSGAPLTPTPVIITFDRKPTSAEFAMLHSLGITGGYVTDQLPMVLTRINLLQFNELKRRPEIKSLYANRLFRLFDLESRTISGVENLIRDRETIAINNGIPFTGRNIGVSYIDTGIDATHPDLQLGQTVVQNVFFATAEVPLNLPSGFVPIIPIENNPMTDVEGGHGTFGAGVVAGSGSASGGLFQGMAPGAKLIGITAGNDLGLSTFAIVQAMDYTLVNQFRYNIRICNNSYGTTLA
ncbi:MAG: peptidase S8, partial [Blastocatellia bacterium]